MYDASYVCTGATGSNVCSIELVAITSSGPGGAHTSRRDPEEMPGLYRVRQKNTDNGSG
jgi:hypothetical protein